MRRTTLSAAIAAVALAVPIALATPALATPAHAAPARPIVTVGGAVATPTAYTLAQLAALPATTDQVPFPTRHGSREVSETGVPLESLVNAAGPTLLDVKNASLRVVVTVVDARGDARTFAWGELDSSFGDHTALLALVQNGRPLRNGPELVVPGDRNRARWVADVRHIDVAVENPALVRPPSVGALDVEVGTRTTVLTAAELTALPERTLHVTFEAGTVSQSHVETGPTLSEVLTAAHVRQGLTTWVAAVGSDGYVAVVTPAEAWIGGRPLLVSLDEDGVPQTQPRLVTDGDVKGGRYVSGVDDLVVGSGGRPTGRP